MIEVQRVSKVFGATRAVDDVSLSLRPGEVAGLLGPNGAGKTTLIRMMTSYLSPTAGRISVLGHDTVLEPQASRAAIGYLPESAPLYPEMSVEGYLSFRARLFGVPRAARKAAIASAVERCWLREVLRKRIGHLSKGYRQRVGLAAAILHDPKVLILDEPTSGLDPVQIAMMRGLIRELSSGRVVLLSSHILSEVELTCRRVVIVTRGRVRADGTPEELTGRYDRSPRFTVEFGASADRSRVEPMLRAIAGVGGVSAAPSSSAATRYTVVPTHGTIDLGEAIAAAARDAGLLLRELHRERPSLEQVFMSILESREECSP